jgi:PEP-CTERM motif
MRLMSRIAPLLVVLLVGLMSGRAEASRIEFNGAGSQGAIIWDGDGDVSTMASNCGASVCDTSVFGAGGFGVLVTTDDPGGVAALNISAIHLLLSPLALPNPCGGTDVECGAFNEFLTLSDSGWAAQPGSGSPDPPVEDNTQPLIRLAMTPSANTSFYGLTAASLAFLASLNPTDLATYHVGMDVTRNNAAGNLISFTVETAPPPSVTPVPEPGTLLLLGSGLAVMARARRRVLR